jgi:DNA-binding beta-propeller fold protein YncE
VHHPDGLAFSQCGRWLAVANHGNGSVSIFQRRSRLFASGKLGYGPEPVAVIDDKSLPSASPVAFTPQTNHLIVTNAGGNFFSIYAPQPESFWPAMEQGRIRTNGRHRREDFSGDQSGQQNGRRPQGTGGHGRNIAVCSPEIRINIYSFEES